MLKTLQRATVAILLGIQLAGWIGFLPGALRGATDFRAFYTASLMVRSGQRRVLYDDAAQAAAEKLTGEAEPAYKLPFAHLAYETLLFLPFTLLRYPTAYLLFMAANVVLLALSIRRLQLVFSGHSVAVIAIAFLPTSIGMMQGQDSIITLMICVFSLWALSRGEDLQAGLIFGLAMYKFQIVLPVAVLFFLWKRWRFVAGVAVTAAIAITTSILITGWRQVPSYFRVLKSMSTDPVMQMGYGQRMPTFRGLVYGLMGSHLTLTTLHVVVGTALVLVLGLTWWKFRLVSPKVQFIVALVAMAFTTFYMLIYDWVMLIPALLLCVSEDDTLSVVGLVLFTSCALAIAPHQLFLAAIPLGAFLWTINGSEGETLVRVLADNP